MSSDTKPEPGMKDLERAKFEAELAKKRLSATLSTLQERLRPSSLANEAWSGVKEKSNELADTTIQAVKDRPAAVSGVVAAIAIFLARHPLMSAAGHLFGGDDNDDLVTTKVSKKDDNYDLAAPAVSRSVKEGVIA